MKETDKNNILIIDDETANIIALTNILSREYNVYAAKNGNDGIKTVYEQIPDLIILDIIMPGMNGFDVISELKNSEKTRDIPVIFISGLNNEEAEEKGLAMGAADYIIKPFTPGIVRLRVRNQLNLTRQARAIKERLQQQMLMTRISRKFLIDAYDSALFTDTLRMIGEFMNITQVLLYMIEENRAVCRNEWIKPEYNLETRIGEVFELSETVYSSVSGTHVIHSSDPYFKELMKPYRKNFHSYIMAPIFNKGKLCAILDFSIKEDDREWSASEENLAVLVASIFSSFFEREAMERQFSIVENSPNLIFYITADSAVEYINPTVLDVTGYTKSELVARGLGIIFDETTLADIKEKHIPNAMRGKTSLFEAGITCKSGEKRILMLSIFQTDKNNLGIITKDFTEIRKLEKDLVAAKERAEHSSRVKSEFLARMSHEMRTPLNAIMGMLQLIQMQHLPDTMTDFCDEMENASLRLMSMIDDVLDISGMEYGAFTLSDSVFAVNLMFKDIIRTVNYNASVKQQKFVSNIDPAFPAALTGDEKRLKQIIISLLSNAVKFTPEQGEISLDARIIEQDQNTVTLQVQIADNGIGIPKEQQDHIFDIFYQADGGISRKEGGIGAGLPLSKRFAEMMDGSIWVESEPGKGSKFTFTCKLKKPG